MNKNLEAILHSLLPIKRKTTPKYWRWEHSAISKQRSQETKDRQKKNRQKRQSRKNRRGY